METFKTRLKREQLRVMSGARNWIFAYVILTSALYVIVDVYFYEDNSINLIASILVWGAGYVLFVKSLEEGGYLEEGIKTGIGTYFALAIFMGILVGLGLVVLVIPGLYLIMRWLPAYCRALLSEDGVANSMWWSWGKTEGHQRSLSLAMLGPVAITAASIGILFLYDAFYDQLDWYDYVASTIASNLLMSTSIAWFTILGIAAYGCLIEGEVGDEEIGRSS